MSGSYLDSARAVHRCGDRTDERVFLYAIIWLVLIGVVGWSLGNMAGQPQYAQILGAEPSALDMITGLVGATVSCHLFLYNSSTR